METQTRFESSKEFKPIWDLLPSGSIAWKVKTFDGNTGDLVSIEYTLDHDDGEDMSNVYGCENFIPQSEWNNAMLEAMK